MRPRVISYSATVAAMAALSESVAIGMRARRSQAAATLVGQPLALGADEQRDSGWAVVRTGRAAASSASAPSAISSPGSSIERRRRARAWTVKIAPMLARTAFGPWGSAQPGPSATQEAPNAWAERSTVPTLPGSPTPCR